MNMNQDKFEQFSKVYRESLVKAFAMNPDNYILCGNEAPETAIPKHAERILAEIKRNPMGVNYVGKSFQMVCKALGIKFTRKAIFEFLEIDKL